MKSNRAAINPTQINVKGMEAKKGIPSNPSKHFISAIPREAGNVKVPYPRTSLKTKKKRSITLMGNMRESKD
jgi:hypothetical protein